MANKNLSTEKDRERLEKKVKKLKEIAWEEMNEISGNDPKYINRLKVWQAYENLFIELGGNKKSLTKI